MRNDHPILERELGDLLGTGRNAGIAARCYGFDGQGGGSFRAVGHAVGLTRERVRQIVDEISKRLTGQPVPATLDRTIAFVVRRIPAPAKEIEAELRSQGLTSGAFRLEGVIKAAELLGRRAPFGITKVKGVWLVHAGEIPSIPTIIWTARREISRWGMATISGVAAEVSKVDSIVCDKKLVASVLPCLGGFAWLDRSRGWFWLSDNWSNPVLNRIRKMLSVACPLGTSDLRAGLAREYRMKAFSAPRRVFLEFCRQAPGLCVTDNMIKARPRINPIDVLTQTERGVIQVLTEHGGTITASEFISACLGRGVNQQTYYLCLVRSPVIAKYTDTLYGLIGSTSIPRNQSKRLPLAEERDCDRAQGRPRA